MTEPTNEDSASLRLARGFLGRSLELTIDRPYGSRHPRHDFVYLANYGFVPGTVAPDGAELDAYYLGPSVPMLTASGTCVAIVHRQDDDDDKLVVIPSGTALPEDDAIAAAVEFQEIPGRYSIIRESNVC